MLELFSSSKTRQVVQRWKTFLYNSPAYEENNQCPQTEILLLKCQKALLQVNLS